MRVIQISYYLQSTKSWNVLQSWTRVKELIAKCYLIWKLTIHHLLSLVRKELWGAQSSIQQVHYLSVPFAMVVHTGAIKSVSYLQIHKGIGHLHRDPELLDLTFWTLSWSIGSVLHLLKKYLISVFYQATKDRYINFHIILQGQCI